MRFFRSLPFFQSRLFAATTVGPVSFLLKTKFSESISAPPSAISSAAFEMQRSYSSSSSRLPPFLPMVTSMCTCGLKFNRNPNVCNPAMILGLTLCLFLKRSSTIRTASSINSFSISRCHRNISRNPSSIVKIIWRFVSMSPFYQTSLERAPPPLILYFLIILRACPKTKRECEGPTWLHRSLYPQTCNRGGLMERRWSFVITLIQSNLLRSIKSRLYAWSAIRYAEIVQRSRILLKKRNPRQIQ